MLVARRLIALCLFAAVLVVGWQFAAANEDYVRVDLLFVEFADVSMWIVLSAAFATGVLLAGLLGFVEVTRAGLLGRRYRRAVTGLEAEVHQLRSLALSPEEPEPIDDTGA